MGVFERLPLFSPPLARSVSSARCERLPDRRARRFNSDWRKFSRSVLLIVFPDGLGPDISVRRAKNVRYPTAGEPSRTQYRLRTALRAILCRMIRSKGKRATKSSGGDLRDGENSGGYAGRVCPPARAPGRYVLTEIRSRGRII